MSYVSEQEIVAGINKAYGWNALSWDEIKQLYEAETSAKYKDMFSEPIDLEHLSFNPIIYDNEPYTPPETAQDIVNDYVNALNVLRMKYLETNDERYARLLLDLVPADTYWRYS